MITPSWPAPKHINAYTTTRDMAGVSRAPYDSFNLAIHVGDDEKAVLKNRAALKKSLNLQSEPVWLMQQHTNLVIDAHNPKTLQADGAYTDQRDIICSVLTADCLPLLLTNRQGTEIAAVHCGWKGIANDIINQAVKKFKCAPKDILAWLGPAISQKHFEVTLDVKNIFTTKNTRHEKAFKPIDSTHFLANIYELAKTE